jgi:hypothetical protein
MDRFPICDICGRPETKFQVQNLNGQPELEMDEDGLWICSECRAKLVSKPTGYRADDASELDERIRALVGKSAGAICHTTNLTYEPPYQSIIDAASTIAYDEDRYMSAWSFVTQWMDGTTVWQSPDRIAKALVSTDGNIQIETRA